MTPIRPDQLCIAKVPSGNYLCTTIERSFVCSAYYGGVASWMIKLLQPAKGVEAMPIMGIATKTPFNVGEAVCCMESRLFPLDELDEEFEVEGNEVRRVEKPKDVGTPEKIKELEPVS